MSRPAPRREAETYSLTLLADRGQVEGAPGQHGPGHRLHVTIGRDLEGRVNELFFVGRGKSGHGLDELLSELGVKLSRILQGRDPETGAELG